MPSYRTYLILYTGIILLGTNGLFAKGIPLDATTITYLRSVIAAVAIAGFLLISRRSPKVRQTKKLLGIYGLGIIMGLHWITFFHSMQIASIAIGMISLFTFPIIVVLMEAAIKGSRAKRQDILSGTLVLMGIVIMAGNELSAPQSATLEGIAWGVISALLFAARNVTQKYYFADISSDKLMLHQTIAISVMLIGFSQADAIGELSPSSWAALIALGLLTTAGAHTLLVISYKKLAAKTVAMISCLQPVIGAVLGWWVLGEQPSFYIVIGGLMILAVALHESLLSQ